jgi:hypothetical protein
MRKGKVNTEVKAGWEVRIRLRPDSVVKAGIDAF